MFGLALFLVSCGEDPTHGGRVEGTVRFKRVDVAMGGGLSPEQIEVYNEEAKAEAEADGLEYEPYVDPVITSKLQTVELAKDSKEPSWKTMDDESYRLFRVWYNNSSNHVFDDLGKPEKAYRLRLSFPNGKYTVLVGPTKEDPKIYGIVFVFPDTGDDSIVYRRDTKGRLAALLGKVAP